MTAIEPLRLLAVAFQFLTRLPVPQVPVGPGDLRRATAWFPLVGLCVAAAGIATRAGAEPVWGAVAATLAAVVVEVAVTGAFHEDGLADACDGLWGGWTPEQRLEIMRDSRLGTYGLLGVAGVLALRVALLAALPFAAFAAATVLGHVLGRASILVMVRLLGPVADRGTGAQVAEPVGTLGTAVAALTVLVVVLASTSVLGTRALWAVPAALVPVRGDAAALPPAARWAHRRRARRHLSAGAACGDRGRGGPGGSGVRADARVVLVRHAEHGAPGTCVGQSPDPPLAAAGRAQALALRARLGVTTERTLCSPSLRARQTAELLDPDTPPELDPRWHERHFGGWEGRAWSEIWAEVDEQVQRDPVAWATFTPPGAETAAAVSDRVVAALGTASEVGTALVVTHAGPIRAALAFALGVDVATTFRFAVDHARATVLARIGDDWLVEGVGR